MQRYFRQGVWALLICAAGLAGFHAVGRLIEVAALVGPSDLRSGCTQALLDRETGHTVLDSCPNKVTLTAQLGRRQ